MITKLDHISILAREPKKTIEFYTKFLGFKLTRSQEIPEMNMKLFFIESGDNRIEILSPTQDSTKMTDGIKHLAFVTDDIHQELKRFREKGATLLHQQVQKHDNMAFFFARSPSGEFLEIIQYINEGE